MRVAALGVGILLLASNASAQSTRLAALLAEERRAATVTDLAAIRAGVRSIDTDTALLSIRALGRLERPALVPDIGAALRFELPELRAEAAHAVAAAFGRPGAPPAASLRAGVFSALNTLVARLDVETVADVRGAICESIGLLPYVDADEAALGEHALVAAASQAVETGGALERLGAAKGFDAFVRFTSDRRPPSQPALDAIRALFLAPSTDVAARVRRLTFGTLVESGGVDAEIFARAAGDPDPQVRMLAMAAAARLDLDLTARAVAGAVQAGLVDSSPLVRLEALHAQTIRESGSGTACALARAATGDPDMHVALAAIDALGVCGSAPEALAFLERTVSDLTGVNEPRGWHRTAHALVALAGAAPERAEVLVPQFTTSRLWQFRLYAVRAAAVLNNRNILEAATRDADSAVADEAVRQLARLTGDSTGGEGRPAPQAAPPRKVLPSVLTAADLKRLAAARARITVRGVGSFDLALLTMEAPATVLRFARLAESGYYDGLTIDRVLPNFVIQTRTPGSALAKASTSAKASADEPADKLHAPVEPEVDPSYPHDELSAWPHVRGALALSSDGRQPGDAQLFIDIVDNPRFDHQYTVFAHTLNGLEVIDALLEGDVIEKIDILP